MNLRLINELKDAGIKKAGKKTATLRGGSNLESNGGGREVGDENRDNGTVHHTRYSRVHLLTHHNRRRKNQKQAEPKHCHVNNTNMHSDYQKDLEDELKKALAVCVMAALAGVGAVGVGIQLDLFPGR